MSQALAPMSLDEFLVWERQQEFRWEFDGLTPVAMTGGTLGHRVIADTMARALSARLDGSGCRVFAGDVKVLVAGRVRYPDVVVTCTEVDLSSDIVPEPVLVIEVLSPSTARTDRFMKLEEYRATASIQHYLIVEQASRDLQCFTREANRWLASAASGNGTIGLPALGIWLSLADIYGEIGLAENQLADSSGTAG